MPFTITAQICAHKGSVLVVVMGGFRFYTINIPVWTWFLSCGFGHGFWFGHGYWFVV